MKNSGKIQTIKDGKFYVKKNDIPSENKNKQKKTKKKFFYIKRNNTPGKLSDIRDIVNFPIRILTAFLTLFKLKIGDIVYGNDTIVPSKSNGADAQLDILLDTNETITINNQEEVKLDTSLFETTLENEELAFNSDAINNSLNALANTQSDTETTTIEATEENTINDDDGAFVGKFDQRDNKEEHLSANHDEQSVLNLNEASAQNNENEISPDLVNTDSEDEAPNRDSSDKSNPSNSSFPKLTITGSSVRERSCKRANYS